MTQETVGIVLEEDPLVVSIIAHEAAIAQAAVTEKGDNHGIRAIQGHRDDEEAHLNPASRHLRALIATGLVNRTVSQLLTCQWQRIRVHQTLPSPLGKQKFDRAISDRQSLKW